MKPVPYPPEIKARGWSFDLDVERIEASDSWALAGNELQPWLLKTWYVAWKSQPVGSMPADPRLFAARIGMPWGQFQDAADVLMRGWTEHADGLLYHPTITEKVNEMIDRRVKDRIKTQKYRERLMPKDHEGETIASPGTGHDVTSDTPGTNHGVPGEQQVSSTPVSYTHLTLPTICSV